MGRCPNHITEVDDPSDNTTSYQDIDRDLALQIHTRLSAVQTSAAIACIVDVHICYSGAAKQSESPVAASSSSTPAGVTSTRAAPSTLSQVSETLEMYTPDLALRSSETVTEGVL